jgi:hypothetical protein
MRSFWRTWESNPREIITEKSKQKYGKYTGYIKIGTSAAVEGGIA